MTIKARKPKAPDNLSDLSVSNETHLAKTPQLSQPEKRQILTMRQSGLSLQAIADALKRSISTVHSYLQPFEDTTVMAKARLAAGAERAADAWVGSLEVAAAEGNHKPAKDLLEAVGVIQPQADTQIAVVVNTPGSYTMPAELVDIGGESAIEPAR